jgi:hypothetical protein
MFNIRRFPFLIFILLCGSIRAEQFGDVSVSADAMFTGNTFHGYAEVRVSVENRSTEKTHGVMLIYPNTSYGNYGNNISRLTRSVTLAPGVREVVSLLQPPLPAQGDGQIRVEVDGHHEGEIHSPNNNHCNNYSYSGREIQATLLVSRSLDFDAVTHLFNASRGAFTAAMATGAPDSSSSRGSYQPTTWMPDTRRGGQTNWLELDYATPQTVNKITVHNTQSPASSGFITLLGASGTNLAKLPMSSGRNSSRGPGWVTEFSFPTTSEPVKTVSLDFERTPPYTIAIDAVEISGPSGSQWASGARASSDNSASASAYAPGSVTADTVESLRAESPVSEWSENWLAYTPFDAVVLNAADLCAMPPAVFNALAGYVSAGGNIFLAGQTELPAAWRASQKKSLPGGAEFTVGFGRCFAFAAENSLATLDSKSVQTLHDALREAAQYWKSLPEDSASANGVLSVVKNLKIPTRGIVIVMLAFVIIIGPVNIIYLNRRNRRTWLLWTIPAISFATTLLVFAYSLLREGITPDTRIAGLTVIDQAAHRATTIGATAFYCPLTPSGGLHFEYETEATPLVQTGYGSGTSREVDWTQSQHFGRGWVSARVPAFFHLRKSEIRRERLEIENQNGELKIVNGLGAQIKSLWLSDVDGKIYQGANIPAGQKFTLIPSNNSTSSEKSGAEGLLHDLGFAANADALTGGAEKYLSPGTYLATLDGNPFIENALGAASSPKRTQTGAVVFGILDSPETK